MSEESREWKSAVAGEMRGRRSSAMMSEQVIGKLLK